MLAPGLNLTHAVLTAQTTAGSRADLARQRMERSLQKQRNAVAAMTDSILAQQRSVRRQPVASHIDLSGFRSRLEIPPAASTSACDPLPPREINSLVDTAAARTSVPPELLRSVMRQESAFRPCAISTKGAMGLMQLIPGTAREFGVADAFDPEQNVLGGARLLKQLLDRYNGDLSMTLSAYNAGVRPVDAAGGVPLIPETMDYVNRIIGLLTQSDRDSAPETSFRTMGSDSGK